MDCMGNTSIEQISWICPFWGSQTSNKLYVFFLRDFHWNSALFSGQFTTDLSRGHPKWWFRKGTPPSLKPLLKVKHAMPQWYQYLKQKNSHGKPWQIMTMFSPSLGGGGVYPEKCIHQNSPKKNSNGGISGIVFFSKVTLDLERFQDADALDVGCGFGRWTAMLKSIGAKVSWFRNRGSASGFESGFSNNPFHTWRIIPGLAYVVNNHDDRKTPKPSYFPSEWLTMVCKWWLLNLLTTMETQNLHF